MLLPDAYIPGTAIANTYPVVVFSKVATLLDKSSTWSCCISHIYVCTRCDVAKKYHYSLRHRSDNKRSCLAYNG